MPASATEARPGRPRNDSRAMREILAAIAYGEWKAYEGANSEAAGTPDETERRVLRTIAAEELRHHRGFLRLLEARGGDPEAAMAPYRTMLDHFHAVEPTHPLDAAVWRYLGEGVADDLLRWLRRVSDPEMAEFVDSVIEDEVGHEARAREELRTMLATTPRGRLRAGRAARRWLATLATSGTSAPVSLTSFLQVGKADALLGGLVRGYIRRMRSIGLAPLGTPLPRVIRPG